MLTATKAYSLDLMGVTRWSLSENDAQPLLMYRPHFPWSNGESSSNLELSDVQPTPNSISFQTHSHNSSIAHKGFTTETAPKLQNPDEQNRSFDNLKVNNLKVNSLKAELGAAPEVIVEDLQPIEELAVEIDVPEVKIDTTLPRKVQCLGYCIANQILIFSDVPSAFHDMKAIEKLAINMSQALLKQQVTEWQSSVFHWPAELKNPYFLERSDWMLGAFESFLERQITNASQNNPDNTHASLKVVLAGQNVQKLVSELSHIKSFENAKVVEIVSLPELYRIPEYKVDAWKTLQVLLD